MKRYRIVRVPQDDGGYSYDVQSKFLFWWIADRRHYSIDECHKYINRQRNLSRPRLVVYDEEASSSTLLIPSDRENT